MTIIAHQLTKHYGRAVALHNLSFTITSGAVGLLGPNGAGKTTLLRLLTGMFQPSRGELTVLGYQLGRARERLAMRHYLGYVPQHLQFFPSFTGREFVAYIAQLKGMTAVRERQIAVDEALELVGLHQQMNHKTRTYSGGMLRRLGIAQAIVNRPHLLIVDEPTAGLDPEERVRFRHLLVSLGSTRLVLLSTHIVEDIVQTCSDVLILKQQVLYHGSIQTLIRDAQAAEVAWDVRSDGRLNDPRVAVVGSRYDGEHYHYRIVGPKPDGAFIQPATSIGLEEAYLWTMQRNRHLTETN